MIRHVPFWLDRFPKSRRPSYPRFRGEAEARVAIIGGGLTGCACAWSFAAAGIRTIVIEADRIGAGATASGPGMVREDFDASFQETASLYGLRAARVLWQGMRRASLEFAATLRRLRIRCDLAPQDLLTIALRDPDAGRRLRREYEARRAAGLDHTWMTPAAVAITKPRTPPITNITSELSFVEPANRKSVVSMPSRPTDEKASRARAAIEPRDSATSI